MGKGLGPAQLNILSILKKAGGALSARGILIGLCEGSLQVGTKEYNRSHAVLSRSLRGLRTRQLVEIYSISVAGRAAVIVSLTRAGVEVAREWEEEG